MQIELIKSIAAKTLAGEITFPQVVGQLIELGVEAYHIDFVRSENRYYNADGESHVIPAGHTFAQAAKDFNTEAVVAAIRKSQQGLIHYPVFVDEVLKAGCVYYIAYLAGRRVIYFGRNGDMHVEHFPNKS